MQPPQSFMIEDYQLSQVLGEGQYGKVYKAHNLKNNKLFAMKVVQNTKFVMDPKLEEFTMNEIQALARISNPHVIQFVEMIKTQNHYYFAYEFCNGGDLEGLLKKRKKLPEEEAFSIFKQVAMAFTSLVKENIMHRDLKPANLLFHNGSVKLADFGFCKAMSTKDELTNSMVGSPIYMAPEVLLGKQYDSRADLWSLGCVYYEMLYGECPFETSSMASLMSMVEKNEVPYPVNKSVSDSSIQILRRILVKDFKNRISWEDLFHMILNSEEQRVQSSNLNDGIHRSLSKGLLYLLQERNKVLFLFQRLEEILRLNFPSRNLPVVIFLYCKYVCQVVGLLKVYVVDSFNISMFKNIPSTDKTNWPQVQDSFEFKGYCKILTKEYEHIMGMLPQFKTACEKYKEASSHLNESELQKDFDSSVLHQSLLHKVVLDYVEEIKNKYFNKMLDQGFEEEMKKWLLHCIKILDSLIIDETFSAHMDLVTQDLRQQHYFSTLEANSKSNLLNQLNKKISYLKEKQH